MKYLLTLIGLLLVSFSFAHHFTGTYQDQQYGITVAIQHGTDGRMQGTVSANGVQMQLQGYGDPQGAQGVLSSPQGQIQFQAQISQDLNQLTMTLMSQGGNQQLMLRRVNATPSGPSTPLPPVQPRPVGPQPGSLPNQPAMPGTMPNVQPGTMPGASGGNWNGTYIGDNGSIVFEGFNDLIDVLP